VAVAKQTNHQAIEHVVLPDYNMPDFVLDFVCKLPGMGNAFV
jgi:hypothetical protein